MFYPELLTPKEFVPLGVCFADCYVLASIAFWAQKANLPLCKTGLGFSVLFRVVPFFRIKRPVFLHFDLRYAGSKINAINIV